MTTRLRSRREAVGGWSDSSLDVDVVEEDVVGVLYRGVMASIRTSRSRETDMVASDAISRARVKDRGAVVKTTKYEIELVREKLAGCGNVT